MRPRRSGEWLIGLLSLAIVTAVHGGPTGTVHETDALICSTHRSEAADVPTLSAVQVTLIDKVHNASLANVADELLRPPADSPLSATSSLPAGATSLPAVPGAVFMALAGFLCVSLVRDRKFWTAALVGLLWAGQVGVTALPQLARHLASRRQAEQLYSPNFTGTEAPDDLDRLRSDIEGTTYIGLLRHLASIPRTRPLPMGILSLRAERSNLKNQRNTRYAIHDTSEAPQSALTEACAHILPATKRLACITKWHACFSPAFIFSMLARGPPPSA